MYSKCNSLSQHHVAPKTFAVHWTDWFKICRCYFTSAVLTVLGSTHLQSFGLLFNSQSHIIGCLDNCLERVFPQSQQFVTWNIAFCWNTRANCACRFSLSTIVLEEGNIEKRDMLVHHVIYQLYWMYFTTSRNQRKYLTVHYKWLLNVEKWLEWSMKSHNKNTNKTTVKNSDIAHACRRFTSGWHFKTGQSNASRFLLHRYIIQ